MSNDVLYEVQGMKYTSQEIFSRFQIRHTVFDNMRRRWVKSWRIVAFHDVARCKTMTINFESLNQTSNLVTFQKRANGMLRSFPQLGFIVPHKDHNFVQSSLGKFFGHGVVPEIFILRAQHQRDATDALLKRDRVNFDYNKIIVFEWRLRTCRKMKMLSDAACLVRMSTKILIA